jgi:hypothetical protein
MLFALGAVPLMVALATAQTPRPASPPGSSATQVGGAWVKGERGDRYEGGKWIEVAYGRPIKRGREALFGSGTEYGKGLLAGTPVWRAGANATTRLKTEVPLQIGDKTVPAGEYSLFVDLKNDKEWTLIVSGWPAQQKYDPNDKTALWGSYGYTPDKDVVRATMKVETLPFSVDQLTIAFLDMTNAGGRLALMWDRTMASVPFTTAGS